MMRAAQSGGLKSNAGMAKAIRPRSRVAAKKCQKIGKRSKRKACGSAPARSGSSPRRQDQPPGLDGDGPG